MERRLFSRWNVCWDCSQLPRKKDFGLLTFGVFPLSRQVVKRGMAPGGGGEVFFSCPACRSLKPVQLTDPGKIKRIRGVAYPSPTRPVVPLKTASL